MSFDNPIFPQAAVDDLRFGVVASRFNNELMEALLSATLAGLQDAGVAQEAIDVLRVPGANEVPYCASMLAEAEAVNCVIALGLIIAGDTNHHDVLAQSTSVALQDIAMGTGVPTINGIITTHTVEQAQARCGGEVNRGLEFAQAAIEMARHHVFFQDQLDF